MCFFYRRFCPSTYASTPHGAKNDDSASNCNNPLFYFFLLSKSFLIFRLQPAVIGRDARIAQTVSATVS